MESLRILGSSIIVKNLCALFTSYDFINFTERVTFCAPNITVIKGTSTYVGKLST